MASLESNSITAASGKVDTEALDLQAAVWGFTARKRFSAAPCCKHNSNRLVESCELTADLPLVAEERSRFGTSILQVHLI